MSLSAERRPRFSDRTAWDRTPSELVLATADVRSTSSESLLDLTSSNPLACGFVFDESLILPALARSESLTYNPDPLGLLTAREAVSRYYARHGAQLACDDLLLTASTSEAYSHLFRLLCNPQDEVLVAQPGYPLFDFLADLSDVALRPYPIFYDHGWWIDFARLEAAITPRSKAIIVVHPNNPTGHLTTDRERAQLERLCHENGLALIVDEVFLDFAHEPGKVIESFASGSSQCLTFVLSGVSKIAALPQMKVAWIAVTGPEELRHEAKARLELIADTFLSVNTPAQLALPTWLEHAGSMQKQILDRVSGNLRRLYIADVPTLEVAAGWTAIVQLERTYAARNAFTALLERGILVHPGEFYGLSSSSQCVLSLIVPEERLARAVDRLR